MYLRYNYQTNIILHINYTSIKTKKKKKKTQQSLPPPPAWVPLASIPLTFRPQPEAPGSPRDSEHCKSLPECLIQGQCRPRSKVFRPGTRGPRHPGGQATHLHGSRVALGKPPFSSLTLQLNTQHGLAPSQGPLGLCRVSTIHHRSCSISWRSLS